MWTRCVPLEGCPFCCCPASRNLPTFSLWLMASFSPGGGDIDISLYGGVPHPEIHSVDLERDQCELELTRHLYQARLPTLGICRGIQLFAVASGGGLIPHIPDEVGEAIPHTDEDLPVINHLVELEEDSQLAQIMGVTRLEVPSSHHQAAREEPAGWRVVARSPDGIIEAMEREGHPWMIAVQWHPERAPDDPPQQALFRSFIEAALQPTRQSLHR